MNFGYQTAFIKFYEMYNFKNQIIVKWRHDDVIVFLEVSYTTSVKFNSDNWGIWNLAGW